MEKLREDDLIRILWVRYSLLICGMASLIIGSKHAGIYGVGVANFFVVSIGAVLIFIVYYAYESLLQENRLQKATKYSQRKRRIPRRK